MCGQGHLSNGSLKDPKAKYRAQMHAKDRSRPLAQRDVEAAAIGANRDTIGVVTMQGQGLL